jgi:hypothetical protein
VFAKIFNFCECMAFVNEKIKFHEMSLCRGPGEMVQHWRNPPAPRKALMAMAAPPIAEEARPIAEKAPPIAQGSAADSQGSAADSGGSAADSQGSAADSGGSAADRPGKRR